MVGGVGVGVDVGGVGVGGSQLLRLLSCLLHMLHMLHMLLDTGVCHVKSSSTAGADGHVAKHSQP